MFEAVSALPDATFDGIARIAEAGLRGMVSIKGDLSATKLKNATTKIAGVGFPGPGEANCADDFGLCWMAPDELLLLTPYAEAAGAVAILSKSLKGTHFLAAEVSDARVLFTVSGLGSREVLAKLTPTDLHPDSFEPGQFRRTRLAQVPAAFWMRDEYKFEVICFRSVAQYVFDILTHAARPGSETGHF